MIRLAMVMVLATAGTVAAASPMTLEEALELGLKNNYDIQIARNEAQIAANNRGRGLAGFLPTLDVSAGYSVTDSEQEANLPPGTTNSDVDNLNAEVRLNWTIFDGFGMFVNRARYDELADLGEYQARNRIESAVVAISRAYFNLVRQEQLLDVARDVLAVSRDRLERERVRHDLGGASSTDRLNAQVVFNADRSSLLNQELQVVIAREELNVLLGRDPARELEVSAEFVIPPLTGDYPEVLGLALEHNAEIKAAEFGRKVAERGVQFARTPFLPRVNAYANYGYGDQTVNSDGGLYPGRDVETQTASTTIGLALSLNLFNGRRDRIELQNARIAADNQRLILRDTRNRLAGEVQQTYQTFDQRMEVVTLEEENIEAARQNLDLQRERHELGVANSLEFRDAQVKLAQARTALITARYQARLARLDLDRLTGALAVE